MTRVFGNWDLANCDSAKWDSAKRDSAKWGITGH